MKINILYKMSIGNVFYRQKKKELDSKRGPRLGSGSASGRVGYKGACNTQKPLVVFNVFRVFCRYNLNFS